MGQDSAANLGNFYSRFPSARAIRIQDGVRPRRKLTQAQATMAMDELAAKAKAGQSFYDRFPDAAKIGLPGRSGTGW